MMVNSNNKKKLYFAAPLFSDAELTFNKRLKEKLSLYYKVYLPQEDGGLLSKMVEQGMCPELAAEKVFRIDLNAINKSEVVLVVLDGRTIDEGASFELGYAFALGKECIGLQTDTRRLLSSGNNPMIDRALSKVFTSIADLLYWASGTSSDILAQ